MKREYFLAETLEAADQTVAVLHHQLHISDRHIRLISHSTNDLRQHNLHSASIIHKTNFVRGLERGCFYSLSFSLIGFCVIAFGAPWWTLNSSLTAVLFLSVLLIPLLAGGSIGAWVGFRNESYKISRFHQDLENGHHLILVDSDRLEPIKRALKNCPVVDKGSDHTLIYPFDQPATVKEGINSTA